MSRRIFFEHFVRYTLGFVFALMAGAYLKSAIIQAEALDFTKPDLRHIGNSLSVFAVACYATTIAFLYMIRLPPISRYQGLGPTIAALLGSLLMTACVLLEPRKDLPFGMQMVSVGLIALGNSLSIIILTQLGRSFSILPESRKLVTQGAYTIIRHPLYLAEAFATTGVLIVYWSPVAIILYVFQLGWQLVRMHFEEKVLMETFPEYRAYALRTKRFIPGIY